MKKKLMLALLLLLAVFSSFAAFAAAGQEELAGKVIRLRVIAAGDLEKDQRIKLQVRDLLLKEIAAEGYQSRDEALLALLEGKTVLKEKVDALLDNEDAGYTSEISIGKVGYPASSYRDFALPAGEYTAVTVRLGEGRGMNWWCVLFPPLCYGMEPDGDLIESGVVLTEETDDLEIRFKFRVLEWIEAIREGMRE